MSFRQLEGGTSLPPKKTLKITPSQIRNKLLFSKEHIKIFEEKNWNKSASFKISEIQMLILKIFSLLCSVFIIQ